MIKNGIFLGGGGRVKANRIPLSSRIERKKMKIIVKIAAVT